MSFIIIEGIDRSGKSSLAKYYEGQGYEVVHMSAPDKKYFREDYSGESYLEEVVRLYSQYDGKDVVFDRSIYGELVWPNIFGRVALLNEEDLEYLSMIERNNNTTKILMFDANTEAHWQRCVDNKEPLTRQQFGRANVFYERLVNDYGFVKKELPDFPEIGVHRDRADDGEGSKDLSSDVAGSSGNAGDNGNNGTTNKGTKVGEGKSTTLHDVKNSSGVLGSGSSSCESIEEKLSRANAIRNLLSGTIIKKKGDVYADLDEAIRGFLQQELDSIFTKQQNDAAFSDDEINILKSLAQRVQDKANQ